MVGLLARGRGGVWAVAASLALLLPLAAFLGGEIWLRASLQSYLDETSRQVLLRVEGAVDRAVASLKDADLRSVENCNVEDREALRLLVFESSILKEIAVLDSRGAVRCNSIGNLVQITPASTAIPTANPQLALAAAVARGNHGRVLRLIWNANDGAILGGLLSVSLFVPHQQVRAADIGLTIDVELSGGTKLASISGPGGMEGPDARATQTSALYPLQVGAGASEAAWRNRHGWRVLAATGGSAALGLILAGIILMVAGGRDATADMSRALARGEFVPYYQPILDIDTGRIVGCEVLVRWRKPNGKIIPPGSFIGEAERSGFIFPLTLALMRQAAAELGPSYAARPHLKCGFNLCAAHFRDDAIVADVVGIFGESDVKLSQVLLEVTERDPLPDMDVARSIIARFQEMGVRVALDDVGTGHGGMSYLLKLRVDVMKIDKLFIDALGSERQSTAIVDSLIDLAAHLNMDIVAEGVETFDQVEALRRRGVRSAQGYVFAPPLPGSSYVQLVEAMDPAAASAAAPVKKAIRG